MSDKNVPKKWQDVDWSLFPKEVTWRTMTLNPSQFLQAFFNDDGNYFLPDDEMNILLHLFGWDYLEDDDYWNGKPFSMGIHYNIPKCCIFEFSMRYERHTEAQILVDAQNASTLADAWILCNLCAEYVSQHGISTYLKDEMWEQDDTA